LGACRAEGAIGAAEEVEDGGEEIVVAAAVEGEVAAGLELAAEAAGEHHREVARVVRAAVAELGQPEHERVVEHRASALLHALELREEEGHLVAVPLEGAGHALDVVA